MNCVNMNVKFKNYNRFAIYGGYVRLSASKSTMFKETIFSSQATGHMIEI